MEKKYYYVSNSDNMIHKTDESNCRIKENQNPVEIEILSPEDEVIDEVNGYETLGDLMESINDGGNDLE